MLDRYISLVLLAAAGASLANAIKLAGGAGGVRGALFPLVLTAGLAICSVILLISTFRPATRSSAASAPGSASMPGGVTAPGAAPASANTVSPERTRQSLIFFAFFVVFVAAIKPFGFLLSSVVMGTVVLRFSFREPWWQAFLVSAVMAFAGWFLFRQVLLVPLPDGTLLKGVMGG